MHVPIGLHCKQLRLESFVLNRHAVEVLGCIRMLLLQIAQILIVKRNRGKHGFKLVLIILRHVLKVVLKCARIISHSLHFKFHLCVVCDILLIVHHLLVNLLSQIVQLAAESISLRLRILQALLKLGTGSFPKINELVLNLDLALLCRADYLDLTTQLMHLLVHIINEGFDHLLLICILLLLHFLFFTHDKFDLLFSGTLLSDFVLEHSHEVFDFSDLAS